MARKTKKSASKAPLGSCGHPEFFHARTIAELAREQGVGPVKDINVFAGGIPDDEDVDEMIEQLYKMREPPMQTRSSAGAAIKRNRVSPRTAARIKPAKPDKLTKKKP